MESAGPAGADRAESAGAVGLVAYWLTIVALYVLQGALWYYPFKGKVFDDGLIAPEPIKEQFDGTFVASFPTTSGAWAILGILQGLIVVALAVSLVRGEFLPTRRKPILIAALAGSLVVFALMLFGDSLTSEFEGVASLYTYFGVTVLLVALVRVLPPYRAPNWLSGVPGR